MICLPVYVSLCLGLLEVTSATSLVPSRHSRLFQRTETTKHFSATSSRNLDEMLDYIRDSPEFHPLIFSIISTDTDRGMVEYLSKYAMRNSINLYKVSASELALSGFWKWRNDVTWVFVAEQVDHLLALIYWQKDLWKPTNQYLIFFMNESAPVSWRDIFEILWQRHNVYRVLVASVQDDFQCFIKYLPFDISQGRFGGLHRICFDERFASSVTANITGGNSSLSDIDTVSLARTNPRLFETFQDFNNYSVNVVVFPSLMMNISYDEDNNPKFSMLDANVMRLLESSLHVTFQVKILQKTGDDPFHQALQAIESGSAEMALTGFFTKTYENYHNFEFSPGIYEDKLCFIAPSSGLVPKYYMLFRPFQVEVWAVLLAYNILITILWFIVGYLSKSFRKVQPIALPLAVSPNSIRIRERTSQVSQCVVGSSRCPRNLDSYMPVFIRAGRAGKKKTLVEPAGPPEINPYVISCFDLTETACYPLHGADTSAQKAFLFGTLFFGLIVTGIYQSSMVSSLSKPFHYPELTTLEDVADSNMTIVTKYWNLKAWLSDDSVLGSTLKDRIDVVHSTLPTNHMVAYTKKVIALGRYASVKLENHTSYYDDEGNKLLHIVEECPASYMLAYALRQRSPYRDRIATILLRMNEAGLVELWYRNLIYQYDVEMKRRQDAYSEKRIKLTLQHYSLTFLGLVIGLFCCTAVFLGELYFAGKISC